MCGRFAEFRDLEALKRHFPIDRTRCQVTANFNVAPTQPVLTLLRRGGCNELDRLHWGLVPPWSKDTAAAGRMINARSETVDTKPSFRAAFKKRRCLILADGFYEWTGPKGDRRPVFLTLPDRTPFAFAGLWETWQDPDPDHPPYRSCAIITAAASAAVRPIHHRMPVILRPPVYDIWLDPDNRDTAALKTLLETERCTTLIHRPVTPRVNSPRHNDPTNIAPMSQMPLTLE
jgi:putative SOS response-associated peptidase YedK